MFSNVKYTGDRNKVQFVTRDAPIGQCLFPIKLRLVSVVEFKWKNSDGESVRGRSKGMPYSSTNLIR